MLGRVTYPSAQPASSLHPQPQQYQGQRFSRGRGIFFLSIQCFIQKWCRNRAILTPIMIPIKKPNGPVTNIPIKGVCS